MIHERNVIKRRIAEDIETLKREIATLAGMIEQMRHDRLIEATPMKPLTPEQGRKKAERDRKRQEQVNRIRSSANQRIADIRAKMGQ
jgi:hypothetical protein